MKIITNPFLFVFLFLNIFVITSFKAQDTIVKHNGDVIAVKITEVGTNAVTYKKANLPDGPTIVDYKSDIAFVKFSNGDKQVFTKDPATEMKKKGLDSGSKDIEIANPKEPLKNNSPSTNTNASKNEIDFLDKKYYINNQKASRKDVDRLLAKSQNPAVIIAHKTAKATKTVQKIVGITSIPSTIGGGFATVGTMMTCFKESKTGPTPTSSLMNLGMSFLGSLTLPITNKILKNRRDKLYNKVIDLYNVAN